jgi:hypothetical protein
MIKEQCAWKLPKYPLNLLTYRLEYYKSYEYLGDKIIEKMVKKAAVSMEKKR